VAFDDFGERDVPLPRAVFSEDADAETTLRVEHAYDVAPTGKPSAFDANSRRAQSLDVFDTRLLLGLHGQSHMLCIGERPPDSCLDCARVSSGDRCLFTTTAIDHSAISPRRTFSSPF
jgi:hypothetical protein